MRWTEADLRKLSGGRGWRAAAILVVVHLAPAPVVLGVWALGLLPIFDDLRWIPTGIAIAIATVAVLRIFRWFGIWATPATGLRGYGEDYEETFSPLVGLGLGWLRWFLQLVLVFAVFVPVAMTAADVRPWQLFGTPELRALPGRAAAIPVPEGWRLTNTEATGYGLTEVAEWPDGREPQGSIEQTFAVPSTYTFDDLEEWVQSPDWADDPDGDSFGAVESEGCNSDQTRCDVRLVPPAGAQPEYFVRATLDADDAEVEVRLSYEKYVAPDWGVSRETVDRATAIPVPRGWVRSTDVVAGTTRNGESVSQFFTVPESTTPEDVEAWLAGSSWTSPSTGEPFGAIEVQYCREDVIGETNRSYRCEAIVVRGAGAAGPIESLSVSVQPDDRVRVNLERNG